jgi:hypothetical protein
MRAIILTRDKQAIFKKINSKKVDFQFRNATFILDSNRVQNYKNEAGQIKGAELIFFEDNPNPVSYEDEPKDLSGDYLDDVVIINFIQQTTDSFRVWNPIDLGFLQWFIKNPTRIPFVLMFLAVAWTLIRDYMSGVLFNWM